MGSRPELVVLVVELVVIVFVRLRFFYYENGRLKAEGKDRRKERLGALASASKCGRKQGTSMISKSRGKT
jgi:hypothetical protein